MKFRLLPVCILFALSMMATYSYGRALTTGTQPQPVSHASYKTEAGDCNLPVAQFDMDVNNVRARLLTAGDMWWDGVAYAQYEVPKGNRSTGQSYPQALYAGSIWVSGYDQGNNLKIAALTYRNTGTDYWPGPLDQTVGTISKSTCDLWDRHFPVWATQITPVVNAYSAALVAGGTPGNITIPASVISDSVKYWPGKGNPYLAALGYNVNDILAPFYDADGDGNYNPTKGDYPTIKQGGLRPSVYSSSQYCGDSKYDSLTYVKNNAFADEMVFWVTNDKGNVHNGTSGGVPIGIQINNLAFAFISGDEINSMTFYTYNIINKSGSVLNQTCMSQYVDPDLGCPNNDRVGCDTSRALGIVYNGVPQGATNTPGYSYVCDQGVYCNQGTIGYGCDLPMEGIDFFEGPTDTTRVPDPANPGHFIHKKLGLTAFASYTNGACAQCDPATAIEFRRYQTGFWKDGTPITFGGNGYQNSSTLTPFMYPGDPSVATQWSECNPQVGGAIPANDRRFVQTSGPFTFLPCASENVTVGVVFIQPQGGVGSNCPSYSLIRTADDKAQALFDAGFKPLVGPSAPLLSIRELDQKVIINVTDDPQGNNVGESYKQIDPDRVRKGFVSGSGLDSTYKFQGYIFYQLASNDVSIDQLNDPTKAKAIYEVDIADGIGGSKLTNWTSTIDQLSGGVYWQQDAVTIPGIPAGVLQNVGIVHSFQDSLDRFGGGNLVNHLTYYYGVISFATNNFRTFNPDSGIGQYAPFLKGRNLNKYSAIPSDPTVENGGRSFNTVWHASSAVKRLEGQGNGGNFIDLTPATIDKILSNNLNYTDTLDYTLGLDPIGLKVTDPLVLKEADFVLTIFDSVVYNGISTSPKAYWILSDITNGVNIHSTRTLDVPYEQIIADALGNEYGFSITLGTPYPVYTDLRNSQPIYNAIGGSIGFKDSTQQWLSFVADTSVNADVKNWIRSGSTYVSCLVQSGISPDPACNVFSDAYYRLSTKAIHFTDSNNLFDKLAGGKWAPYCLTSNWSTSPIAKGNISYSNRPVFNRPATVGGPAFKWDNFTDTASPPRNNLERLQSVDIVLTSDKSKWSRCVVFETGEKPTGGDKDPSGNNIPPRKGMLRGHASLNLDGTYDATDVGRSYFPGYAINIETGQRLEVAFGEASDERDFNGNDMIWNPNSQLLGVLNGGGIIPYKPYFAGRHFIYVLDIPYPQRVSGAPDNGGSAIQHILRDTATYAAMVDTTNLHKAYPDSVVNIYDHIMWTSIPYVTPGFSLASLADGLIPGNNEVTVKLRVQKPYAEFATNATAAGGNAFPRYKFNTKGQGMRVANDSIAKTALDKIRIVPNPYYAYSAYETKANEGKIKVTNLPNVCTIRIYTLDGVLVRTLSRSITGNDPATGTKIEISDGLDLSTSGINIDNTIDWDLKNETNITVASGIYLFDINAPGIGHKILKWFGAIRPTDISNF